MTEDFKKGLATGLAIGGVTVVKGGGGSSVIVGQIGYITGIPTVSIQQASVITPSIYVGSINYISNIPASQASGTVSNATDVVQITL